MTGLAARLVLPKLPWRLIGAIGIAVVLLIVAWRIHHAGYEACKVEAESQRNKDVAAAQSSRLKWYEDQITDYKSKLEKQEADSAKLASDLSAANSQKQALQSALARARLVTREPSTVPGNPPVVRLSPWLRICLNAAITGAADQVASCEALGVHPPATP